MKKILFFVRHFSERGTEIAIYDYAKYNEEILGNKSYIVYFSDIAQKQNKLPIIKTSFEKFKNRFEMIILNSIHDIKEIIEKYNIDYFYTLTGGKYENLYQFQNKEIWGKCKTIVHCVFKTKSQYGDFYISISDFLNKKYKTNIPVIPHIVNLPKIEENLFDNLNLILNKDSIIIGRYGGYDEFNIGYVHDAIKEILNIDNNIFFLFMNTRPFYEHKNIIYLEKNISIEYKAKFINSCNAMIHARNIGETFGLSIGEFSFMNKPIITSKTGDLEHIKILGEKAIIYNSKDDLLNIFNNIRNIIKSRNDWNAYSYYSPNNIMELFNKFIFQKEENK
jgi:hypothetical protein